MKTLLLASAFALLAVSASAGPGPGPGGIGVIIGPTAHEGRTAEYETVYRLFGKNGRWEPMAEALFRWENGDQIPYKAFTGGSYWRAHKNLKLGAFYRLQYGRRHDQDWVETPNAPFWAWADVSKRPESVFILDATPRVQLSMLPGENWILAWRNQYQHNAAFGEGTVVTGPELTYHLMSGLSPLGSVSLQYQAYFPVNYSRATVNEQWLYLSALWHATPTLTLGPQFALRNWVWTSRPEFEAAGGAPYQTTARTYVVGLSLVWRPGRKG